MSHAGGGDKWNHSQLFRPPAARADHRLLSTPPHPSPRLLGATLVVRTGESRSHGKSHE